MANGRQKSFLHFLLNRDECIFGLIAVVFVIFRIADLLSFHEEVLVS